MTETENKIGEGATVLDTAISRPAYYGGANDPYEVIKVIEAKLTPDEFRGWLKGTIAKYLFRPAKKQGLDDALKATWYARYWSEWEKRQADKNAAQKSESIAHHSE